MRIAVIGGGSWATAMVKTLIEKDSCVSWWMRNGEDVLHIEKYHNNPRYLSSVELITEKIDISTDLNQIVQKAECLIFAIPSAFLKNVLKKLEIPLKNKLVFSAIKGIVPDENLTVGEFFNEKYEVPLEQIGVITGPCHAEEVALERLSYLTIASVNTENATQLAKKLNNGFIRTNISNDIYGTEYAAILKNIYALLAGICYGLGFGDNFQAVLVSNAIREMKRLIHVIHPIKRDINDSTYLGDLLVTAYSQFSRNRMFGNMIGKGYTIRSAMLEMNMVAEGYYTARLIPEMCKTHDIKLPIAQATYRILYDQKNPKEIMMHLAEKLS